MVHHDTALFIISGGNNKHDRPPDAAEDFLVSIATKTHAIVAELQGVPSEPLQFSDESRTRVEDQIIAYTYDKYLKTGDPTWPLLLPMTKSAVRAMDTVQVFLREGLPVTIDIEKFVVTGGSKRGWTTWLTGAVDDRVCAVAPVVIDMLNTVPQMDRQLEYYGAYSVAVGDYTAFNIQERMKTPEGQKLLSIVDPYEYRDVLTMPKFVMLGSGDQYWTADSANLYYDDLVGDKWIRYEPNADHSVMKSPDFLPALTAFFYNMANGYPMPEFSAKVHRNGRFRIEAVDPPSAVYVWQASAPTKDFRLMTIGPEWTKEAVDDSGGGVFKGKVAAPDEGYTAFYVEVVYPCELGFNYGLTTEICIPSPANPIFAIALLALPFVLIIVGGVVWIRRS